VDEEASQEGFKEDNDWERSKNMEIWDDEMNMMVLNGNQLPPECGEEEKARSTMRKKFHGDHTTLQLDFKNIQVQLCCNYVLQSATPMQLQFINAMI
jgi:hypothetical protein